MARDDDTLLDAKVEKGARRRGGEEPAEPERVALVDVDPRADLDPAGLDPETPGPSPSGPDGTTVDDILMPVVSVIDAAALPGPGGPSTLDDLSKPTSVTMPAATVEMPSDPTGMDLVGGYASDAQHLGQNIGAGARAGLAAVGQGVYDAAMTALDIAAAPANFVDGVMHGVLGTQHDDGKPVLVDPPPPTTTSSGTVTIGPISILNEETGEFEEGPPPAEEGDPPPQGSSDDDDPPEPDPDDEEEDPPPEEEEEDYDTGEGEAMGPTVEEVERAIVLTGSDSTPMRGDGTAPPVDAGDLRNPRDLVTDGNPDADDTTGVISTPPATAGPETRLAPTGPQPGAVPPGPDTDDVLTGQSAATATVATDADAQIDVVSTDGTSSGIRSVAAPAPDPVTDVATAVDIVGNISRSGHTAATEIIQNVRAATAVETTEPAPTLTVVGGDAGSSSTIQSLADDPTAAAVAPTVEPIADFADDVRDVSDAPADLRADPDDDGIDG